MLVNILVLFMLMTTSEILSEMEPPQQEVPVITATKVKVMK